MTRLEKLVEAENLEEAVRKATSAERVAYINWLMACGPTHAPAYAAWRAAGETLKAAKAAQNAAFLSTLKESQ